MTLWCWTTCQLIKQQSHRIDRLGWGRIGVPAAALTRRESDRERVQSVEDARPFGTGSDTTSPSKRHCRRTPTHHSHSLPQLLQGRRLLPMTNTKMLFTPAHRDSKPALSITTGAYAPLPARANQCGARISRRLCIRRCQPRTPLQLQLQLQLMNIPAWRSPLNGMARLGIRAAPTVLTMFYLGRIQASHTAKLSRIGLSCSLAA